MTTQNSSKRKIALYGGTFNPPTMGHRQVIEEVLNAGIVDNVWVLPSLGKFKKNAVAYAQRMAMCELAFGDMDNVSISSLELALGEKTGGYTANVIDGAHEIFPHAEFYFIIGGDTAEIVPSKWYNGVKLVESRKFITIPRLSKSGGVINTPEDKWYKKSPHVYLGEVNPTSISSTQVRNIYQNGLEAQIQYQLPFLLDVNVLGYIDHFGFYEKEDQWQKRIESKKDRMDLL